MARNSTGNRILSSVIIDNVTAFNLGGDYSFQIDWPDNQSTTVTGANGRMTKFNSDTTARITIGLMPNSTTNDKLFELMYNQSRGNGKLFPMTIISDVGETFTCNRCSIVNAAQTTSGDVDISQRSWVITSEDCIPPTENFGVTSNVDL